MVATTERQKSGNVKHNLPEKKKLTQLKTESIAWGRFGNI